MPFNAFTGLRYWNAATNDLALVAGRANNGDAYLVVVPGATDLGQEGDWNLGDIAYFMIDRWVRINSSNFERERSFPTFAALRLYRGPATTALVNARSEFGDGGGGEFVVKVGDTTTPDDGALVVVDAIGRRWFRMFGAARSVKWWGAKGNGVAVDTAALQAACDALPTFQAELYIPPGDYLTGPLTLPVIFNFTLRGGGRETTNLSLVSAGVLLIIKTANFATIKDIGFRVNGTAQAVAGTTGVKVCEQSGNVTFMGCDFVGFADDGLFFDGVVATSTASSIAGTVLTVGGTVTGTFAVGQTVHGAARGTVITSLGTGTGGAGTYNVSTPQAVGPTAINGAFEMSGHKVINCYALGSGRHQIRGRYSNDFVIETTQVGMIVGVAHAQTGVRLEWCGAGWINKLTTWENVVGTHLSDCDFNSIVDCRLEINDHEGLIVERGFDNKVQVNRGYSNSLAGNGLYANYRFIDSYGLIVSDNKIFTWNATNTGYGMAFEGTCTLPSITGNKIDGFDVTNYGPYNISAATLATGINCDRVLSFATVGTIAAGSVSYVGINGEQDAGYKTGFQLGGGRWMVAGARMFATGAPSAGKSCKYTVYRGSSDSPMTATLNDPATDIFISSTVPTVNMTANTFPSMKVEPSAGATPVAHRGYINLLQY